MVQITSTTTCAPRLALCDRSALPGAVDGVWWPQSSDLRTELPDLVAVLGMSIGPVRRVVYDPSTWPDAPSRIIRGTVLTRVDPYTMVANDTIYLMGTHARSAVLFVVPPAIPVDAVQSVLRAVTDATGSINVAVLRHLVERFAAESAQAASL
jgi:Family of unknown function (DUF5994)